MVLSVAAVTNNKYEWNLQAALMYFLLIIQILKVVSFHEGICVFLVQICEVHFTEIGSVGSVR